MIMPLNKNNPRSRGPVSDEAGFTLVETLIALAVTAIALLGMASLQVAALSSVQSGQQRTQAAFLAYDLTDRMRSNLPALRGGQYDLALNQMPPVATCRGALADCGGGDLAAADLSEWRTLVGSTLVGGDASVATNTPAGTTITNITITISWADSRALPGAEGQDQLTYNVTI